MFKLGRFIVLVLAWIWAMIMIFADKENAMQWFIIMWVIVVGITVENKGNNFTESK